MMSGYQNQPEKTEEASWYDEKGERWQRMGDIGRVDDEGFVTLLGRSKDMIISGVSMFIHATSKMFCSSNPR